MFALLFGLAFGGAVATGLAFSDALLQWMEREYGVEARDRVVRLQQLVDSSPGLSEAEKLERVNAFFNKVRYDSDAALWDQKDYWATPFEVLGINSADCEDYAISKYFTLASMGVDEDRLRITYVKSLSLNEAHMVLAYYPSADAEPVILDNLTERIQPAAERTDLVPVYSFNGADLWLAVNRVKEKKVGDADRLSRWQDFQARLMRQMAVSQ
ncbi:MAG: transglutaminase-like cysteine peptidase [Gammaproteobacteria bacterium]|nr:transglutaminase-like cysteine peptidase [Gammaproteobacteria bacterium]MCB1922652.1 transglutaminase-like cysteine peptidase [Gammaproteobacteria bacterium]